MNRFLPLILLLSAGCGGKYYKVKTEAGPLFNPRVQNILREEGGWAEIKVQVGKKTRMAPVMDVTPDSVKVFTGNKKENDSLWVYPKDMGEVTYVMPMNAQHEANSYARNAFLIGAVSTAVATGVTYLFEMSIKDEQGNTQDPEKYLYVAAGLGGLTVIATGVAYIVGFKVGGRKDASLKKKLNVYLGLEDWKTGETKQKQ